MVATHLRQKTFLHSEHVFFLERKPNLALHESQPMLALVLAVSSLVLLPQPLFLGPDNPPLPIKPEEKWLALLLDEGNSSGVLTELEEVEVVLPSLAG